MIDSKKLIRTLIFCIGFVIFCHLLDVFLGKPSWNFDRLVHMDHEANLPTWFSSMLWAIAAVVAYQCSQLAQVKFEKRLWAVMAFILLILSIDEVAMMHEHIFGSMIGGVIRQYAGHSDWIKWPIIASPFILIVVVWFGYGLRRCLGGSKRCAAYFIAGIIVLIAAACVAETAHYYIDESSLRLLEFEVVIEEAGEMIATFLMICGLLAHRDVLREKGGHT